ncbi:MAG TPA: serine/threonine-protein kinase [Drouetiella sp.]|jgi:eukaryotic-like serine/threonine-protein kinase
MVRSEDSADFKDDITEGKPLNWADLLGRPPQMPSLSGDAIPSDERFEILALIGTGACSKVYKARQLRPSRVVALKVLHPHLLTNAETIARFQREAESGSRLNHASICTVYEYGRLSNGQPFIAMQYLEGESLASLLRRFECLDIEEALPIFISCCNALIAAHEKGIVHRDIKPANIFIQSIGKERDAKLLDFGLAKLLSQSVPSLTQTGIALGTVQYMSPEQILSEPVDARSDIYSLGCVMFQTLTGRQVFEGRTAFEVMEEHINKLPATLQSANPGAKIPSELENVVLKSLAKDPLRRYQNVVELRNALASLHIEPKGRWGNQIALFLVIALLSVLVFLSFFFKN